MRQTGTFFFIQTSKCVYGMHRISPSDGCSEPLHQVTGSNCTSATGMGPCGWQKWSLPTPVCFRFKPKDIKHKLNTITASQSLLPFLEAVCHIGKVPVPCLRSEWHLPILLGREYRYIEYQRWKDYKYHPIQSSQPGNRAAWTTISASLLSHVWQLMSITSPVGSPLGIPIYPSSESTS